MMDSLDDRAGQVLSTNHILTATLAALPTSGVENGAAAWITNGRKSGEGAGLGTGSIAYFNASDSTWRNFYDDGAAVV